MQYQAVSRLLTTVHAMNRFSMGGAFFTVFAVGGFPVLAKVFCTLLPEGLPVILTSDALIPP